MISYPEYMKQLEELMKVNKQLETKYAQQDRKQTIRMLDGFAVPIDKKPDDYKRTIADVLETTKPKQIFEVELVINDAQEFQQYFEKVSKYVNELLYSGRFIPHIFSTVTMMKRKKEFLTDEEINVMREFIHIAADDTLQGDYDQYLNTLNKVIIPFFQKVNNPIEKDAKFDEIEASDQLILSHTTLKKFQIQNCKLVEDYVTLLNANIDQYYNILLLCKLGRPKISTLVNASIEFIETVLYAVLDKTKFSKPANDFEMSPATKSKAKTRATATTTTTTATITDQQFRNMTGAQLLQFLQQHDFNFENYAGHLDFNQLDPQVIDEFIDQAKQMVQNHPKIILMKRIFQKVFVDQTPSQTLELLFSEFLAFHVMEHQVMTFQPNDVDEINHFIKQIRGLFLMKVVPDDRFQELNQPRYKNFDGQGEHRFIMAVIEDIAKPFVGATRKLEHSNEIMGDTEHLALTIAYFGYSIEELSKLAARFSSDISKVSKVAFIASKGKEKYFRNGLIEQLRATTHLDDFIEGRIHLPYNMQIQILVTGLIEITRYYDHIRDGRETYKFNQTLKVIYSGKSKNKKQNLAVIREWDLVKRKIPEVNPQTKFEEFVTHLWESLKDPLHAGGRYQIGSDFFRAYQEILHIDQSHADPYVVNEIYWNINFPHEVIDVDALISEDEDGDEDVDEDVEVQPKPAVLQLKQPPIKLKKPTKPTPKPKPIAKGQTTLPFAKKGSGFSVTPQKVQTLLMAFESGNTSELVRKQIIRGVNFLFGQKLINKKQAQNIKKRLKK